MIKHIKIFGAKNEEMHNNPTKTQTGSSKKKLKIMTKINKMMKLFLVIIMDLRMDIKNRSLLGHDVHPFWTPGPFHNPSGCLAKNISFNLNSLKRINHFFENIFADPKNVTAIIVGFVFWPRFLIFWITNFPRTKMVIQFAFFLCDLLLTFDVLNDIFFRDWSTLQIKLFVIFCLCGSKTISTNNKCVSIVTQTSFRLSLYPLEPISWFFVWFRKWRCFISEILFLRLSYVFMARLWLNLICFKMKIMTNTINVFCYDQFQ